MAIKRTCKENLYVPAEKADAVLKKLQERALFEPVGDAGGSMLSVSIEKRLEKVGKAIAEVEKIGVDDKEKCVQSRCTCDFSEYERAAEVILKNCEKLKKNSEEITDLKEKIKVLRPFFGIEDLSGVTDVYAYKVLLGATEKMLKDSPREVYYEILKNGREGCVVLCVYEKEDREKCERFLENAGFSQPKFPTDGLAPKKYAENAEKRIRTLSAENIEIQEALRTLSEKLCGLKLLYDDLLLKKRRCEALLSAKNTRHVFVLTGYALKEREDELRRLVEKDGAAAEETPPSDGEIMPTAFENNIFVEPVEEITAGYSMPSDKDIDPNPIMAIFYYLFFGMMFSDLGYGLLLIAVCGPLGFSRKVQRKRRLAFRRFFLCGISTALWGIAYGSFFGDIIGAASALFGRGEAKFKPLLLDPVEQALELLILSATVGICHILTALFLQFALLWRDGDKAEAICTVGGQIFLIFGATVWAIGTYENVKNIGIAFAMSGGVLMVLSGMRGKKSPIKRIFSGIFSLYGVTGLVGDILSYSRLMALGLATSVIASVVNVLAGLGGSGAFGKVFFAAVCIVGHSLNFAINMLGAYVHTNRLQYVEFYQKFYNGGGRAFHPINAEGKYFSRDAGKDKL